jgi:formamidopyrimidine-DNA glycosylase
MQALAERMDATFAGLAVARCDLLGFSSLKTVVPGPDVLEGRVLAGVGRRGKYLVLDFGEGLRVLVHLSQAGRVDFEQPAKATRPKGAVMRLVFADGSAFLVREHGTQRKAGWWILAPGDDGPLAGLGPEPAEDAFAALILEGDSTRHVHTLLRDQRTVAGIGRGYADDLLNQARISPFAPLRSLSVDQRRRLLDAVRSVLADGLTGERTREGGLSQARLGGHFRIHNRAGQPCPNCGELLHRVSYDSYEIVYCPHCQTKGKVLADRRLSRLLR